eukprot:scaffold6708_cov153-Pinguiococcus_pyrenoidosus.AAC.1
MTPRRSARLDPCLRANEAHADMRARRAGKQPHRTIASMARAPHDASSSPRLARSSPRLHESNDSPAKEAVRVLKRLKRHGTEPGPANEKEHVHEEEDAHEEEHVSENGRISEDGRINEKEHITEKEASRHMSQEYVDDDSFSVRSPKRKMASKQAPRSVSP